MLRVKGSTTVNPEERQFVDSLKLYEIMNPVLKRNLFFFLVSFLSLPFINGCQNPAKVPAVPAQQVKMDAGTFNDYWYAGKAEVISYKLKQSRYGEIHNGDAVLIFVTEPFSKSKQVKLDYPSKAGEDNVTVMKLNYTKKFNTGLYPYSMMLSAFTPVDTYHHPKTLKVTTSVQEWCGQAYTQMNLAKDKYEVNAFSYFEQEGDQEFAIDGAVLEDEIFNRIRLDHQSLPTGEFKMVPGLFFARLKHEDLKPQKVKAQLLESDGTYTYSVNFEKDDRILNINFEKQFPYQITGWEETYHGVGNNKLTTTAELNRLLYTDYWTKNNRTDTYLRDSLGLQF